jgi:hypothetical protein
MFANGTFGTGGLYDGLVTLNSGSALQFSRPTSANRFDAQRAIEHEIDNVMGFLYSTSSFTLDDLFGWSSPAHRNSTTSGTRYFSIDGGVTNIVNFNQNPNTDFASWLGTTCAQGHPYVQNAFRVWDSLPTSARPRRKVSALMLLGTTWRVRPQRYQAILTTIAIQIISSTIQPRARR